MDDLIRRQDAMKVLMQRERENFNDWERHGNERSFYEKKAYSDSIGLIYDLSSVDAVEVVRCKDCKHWIPYDWMFSEVWKSQNIDDYAESEIGCAYCDMSMGAMDYCSRGERKNG